MDLKKIVMDLKKFAMDDKSFQEYLERVAAERIKDPDRLKKLRELLKQMEEEENETEKTSS